MATIVKLSDSWLDIDTGRRFFPPAADGGPMEIINGDDATIYVLPPEDIATLTDALDTMAINVTVEDSDVVDVGPG